MFGQDAMAEWGLKSHVLTLIVTMLLHVDVVGLFATFLQVLG